MSRSTAVARILRICEFVDDERALRREVLEELRRVVGFDAYVWLLSDPETSVGSAPLAAVPCAAELPGLIRLKYLTVVNRWTTLGSAASAGLLREATRGDLSRSLLWRELLCHYGIGDMASTVFRDPFGCWGFLDLWRHDTSAAFSDAEAALLDDINEPVTRALRRCQADSFVTRSPDEVRRHGPVVLVLSPQLDVLGQTPETHEYLRQLLPTTDEQPVPASAYNVAAQLLAQEAGVDANPPFARVHLSDGVWLTLRAARIGDADASTARDIAVTIQDASPSERVDLFARAFGLTPREGELLRLLATGMDTRELAARMHLSEHTVQDHLKAIFVKTSSHSRRALLSLALGA